jgi:hypothetical protein
LSATDIDSESKEESSGNPITERKYVWTARLLSLLTVSLYDAECYENAVATG